MQGSSKPSKRPKKDTIKYPTGFLEHVEEFFEWQKLDQIDQRDVEWFSAFDELTVQLQQEGHEYQSYMARKAFDRILKKYKTMSVHLAKDASIVQNEDFESGLVALQRAQKSNKEGVLPLSDRQKKELKPFEGKDTRPSQSMPENNDSFLCDSDDEEHKSEYIDVRWIPATSVCVERLFSRSALILTDRRKSLLPITMEWLLMLKANKSLWSVEDVLNITNKGFGGAKTGGGTNEEVVDEEDEEVVDEEDEEVVSSSEESESESDSSVVVEDEQNIQNDPHFKL